MSLKVVSRHIPTKSEVLERQCPRQCRVSSLLEHLRVTCGYTGLRGRARVGVGRGHLLEVTVLLPRAPFFEPDAVLGEIEVWLRSLLGPAGYDDWVGALRLGELPRESLLPVLGSRPVDAAPLSLEELPETLRCAIEGVVTGLPATSCLSRSESDLYYAFELEPDVEVAREDPCRDVVIVNTREPELVKTHLDGLPFFSGRFSRVGERFLALTLAEEGSDSVRLTRRDTLRSRLEGVLRTSRVGCVIGDGLGVEHTVFFLALCGSNAELLGVLESFSQGFELFSLDEA